MEQNPFNRPVSTASALGGERFSQAPTLFPDAENVPAAAEGAYASADDLQPPTALGNRASNAFGQGSPSNLSVAGSSAPLANNFPYRDSAAPTAAGSAQHLGDSDKEAATSDAPRDTSPLGRQSDEEDGSKGSRKKLFFILGGLAALVIIAVAVAVPVALTHKKSSSGSSSSSSSSSSGPSTTGSGQNGGPTSSNPTTNAVTGGDGTTIKTENGTTFTYVNKFGGTWYDDPNDPYNNNAQAQSWTPPLNTSWDYENDLIRGVNLGGWLVPEPFIVPALFEPYVNGTIPAKDEWTLSQAMAADTANGGLNQMETHYKTFITEEDFAQIAAAGLNWIRLPIPFWVVEKYPDEPFLEKVAWQYALKAFKWARKYGLRVNLDLHTIPGSQNGYNHSGKGGQINFLYGPMGLANAQRTLEYIRIITEFISQPEWAPVIPMFGIINEPVVTSIGKDELTSFYLQAHDTIRNITGTGTGKGPFISIHDSFQGLAAWVDLLPGHDRINLDVHPYAIFSSVDRSPLADQIDKPCTSWAADMNTSWSNFGVSVAGEFSLAINDCGLWINGVGAGTRWEGTFDGGDGTVGDCTPWTDYASWTQTTKDDFNSFALRNFDALQHWFFWTWKIGASSVTGKIENPMWSYQLGLQEGWMPSDPTKAVGTCGNTSPATALTAEMLGGAGAGDISATVRAASPWPPTAILPGNLSPANVPVYTPTGTIVTLPVPTPTVGTADGWFDAADTQPMITPIAGCTYPDAWGSADATNPGPCGGTSTADTTTTDNTDTTDTTDTTVTTRTRGARNVIPKPRRTPPPS
ncbi:hypothetical protein FRC04_000889 [Tulasnella sp. 424]|nr:hypothetical protein FRC04_000889 [Tulasnella sp. 424]KAG8975377.1 hypothetical protein FRC05_005707 [Tulasnella sp. 425]